MSSNRGPEKIWLNKDLIGYTQSFIDGVPYIREDLLQISAVNETITQMQVEYHEKIDRLNDELKLARLDQRERIACQDELDEQRRREMFEKVALMFERVALTNFNGDVPDITII